MMKLLRKKWDIKDNREAAYTADTVLRIPGKQSQTVFFKPMSGLLNQPKYLPVRYCPLTIELELVSTSSDPILSSLTGATYTGNNTSVAWQIQNVQVKVDLCTLDNTVDNSYAEHPLSTKALSINYNTYASQLHSVLSGVTGQQKVS